MIRVEFPGPDVIGGVRAFEVHEDGTETEIREILDLRVTCLPDSGVTVQITSFLTKPSPFLANGHVQVICPKCEQEVEP